MNKIKTCDVCGHPIHPQADCCKRCKKLIDRVNKRRRPNKKARLYALKQAWDGEGFRCYYTGIRLVEDNRGDPRYLTFDHRTPGHEDDVVITAALINDVKSDMSEDEFRAVICQIANYFKGGKFDENVFDLKHWKRLP